MSMRGGVFYLLGFIVATSGCGGGSASQPTVQFADRAAVEAFEHDHQVTPLGEPAAAFESKPADARTLPSLEDPLRLRLLQGFQRAGAAARVTVAPDDRLDRAMDDLARALDGGEDPRSEAVEFLLGFHGIVEPYPVMLIMSATPEQTDQVIAHALAELKLPHASVVTVGIGIDSTRTPNQIVVAMQDKHIDLAPVVRLQPSGAAFELTGSLLETYSTPTVYVTVPSGTATERPLLTNGAAFRAQVACDHGDGTYQVEVFGSDTSGPRVLANFTVGCGVEPPTTLAGRGGFVPAKVPAADAEQQLFDLINKARATAGLPALVFDPALARVARAHSSDMLANNYVAHISPITGSPGDRVTRAGLAFTRLEENIGSSSSPDELHQGLMRSPGHRSAILDRQVTKVGVGAAVPSDDQHYRVVGTELFE